MGRRDRTVAVNERVISVAGARHDRSRGCRAALRLATGHPIAKPLLLPHDACLATIRSTRVEGELSCSSSSTAGGSEAADAAEGIGHCWRYDQRVERNRPRPYYDGAVRTSSGNGLLTSGWTERPFASSDWDD